MIVGLPARTGVALILAGLACVALVPGGPRVPAQKPPASPRLAVLVVFDQMRGDYLGRWARLFGRGGFRRLTEQGGWFQNCHYPYAGTWTGAGHATVVTGCSPRVHGIVANEWYDRATARVVSCVAGDRYDMVPPPTSGKKGKGASPHFLLAPTLADVLKDATHGKGRVVALSFKDRSAVLPGGRHPDACYWVDRQGRFVTSTYYRDRPHEWVRRFDRPVARDRWLGESWQRSREDVDYDRWAGPDDVPGEGTGNRQGRTFPHPFRKGKKGEKANYYDALAASPMGNDRLMALACRAIEAEQLGRHDTPDFLSVSFSSNDLVGHIWGPDSQEVLDTTLRSDEVIRDLMDMLDDRVGKGRWVLAMTADHGICPLPEVSRARGRSARRVAPKPFLAAAEEHLDRRYPPGKGEKKGPWIEKHLNHMLYLDRKRMARRGAKLEQVEAILARWAVSQRGIGAAFTSRQLRGTLAANDPLGQKVRQSFYPGRSGDVTLVLKPYWLMTDKLTGTTHGSPHPYDTHVPLLVMGPGIRPGARQEHVSPELAAVVLARALGLAPPARAAVTVPEGLFEMTRR